MKRRDYCCWRPGEYQNSPWNMDWPGEFYGGKSSALEILRIRYAKGEITKEEYEKMKEEITSDHKDL